MHSGNVCKCVCMCVCVCACVVIEKYFDMHMGTNKCIQTH